MAHVQASGHWLGHYNYFRLHYNGDVGELGDFHEDLQFRARGRTWLLAAAMTGAKLQVAAAIRRRSGQMLMVCEGPELFLRASF